MLVVLSIISLLAAILFPIFARAHENARRASCQSNLKQLGLALTQYAQDYDERLPNVTAGYDGRAQLGGWVYYSSYPANGQADLFDVTKGNLYAYTKSSQVYVCPADSPGKLSGLSYAINYLLTEQDIDSPGLFTGKSLVSLQAPTTTALFGEEAFGGSTEHTSTDDGFWTSTYYMSTRHLEGANVAFLDGHVKFYLPDQVDTGQFLRWDNP